MVNGLVPERADAVGKGNADGGGAAVAVPFDVADLEAVQAGAARARAELGGHLDVLVHNAGVPADFGQGQFRSLTPAGGGLL
ncbi:SDR family NAD(P)-dependent oxidoreductase [Streptomyces anulatus]|uniref:SDR family NAD(P)-dependent oxidoreductase n=1 Tax=Streptomyces anulatus TaxID=1892 RepID=UPI001C254A57|nr:SDR family NAD(P)-dependent oxidoreductase [Streptomyces anulatus]